MNTIAAVVVTYNRLETLKKCIESILNQSAGCDLIIVNNASTEYIWTVSAKIMAE